MFKNICFALMFLLLSVSVFGQQQAEEKLVRHVGYQYGDYTPDSLGLDGAITYMATVVDVDNIGIIWLDYPVDTTGCGLDTVSSYIELYGWVTDGTDTNFVTQGLFTGRVLATTINFADATAVGGAADAVTINFAPDLAALQAGLTITYVSEAANTGAATLAVDGGTAKAITEAKDDSALEAGDIASGMTVTLVYNGTAWVQISQSGN